MFELITRSLEEQDLSHLITVPKGLLDDDEKEMLDWILRYKGKYREVPDIATFKSEFPAFVTRRSKRPLEFVRDRFVEKKQKSVFLTGFREVEAKILNGEKVNVPEAVRSLQMGVTDVGKVFEKYSEFDREKYFRTGKTTTGFSVVDKAIGGICNGDFVLIVGRLGTGKSTNALWMAYNWWKQGKRILVVSREMLAADVFSKIDAMLGQFNPLVIRQDEKSKVTPGLATTKFIAQGNANNSNAEIFVPSRAIATVQEIYELVDMLEIDAVLIDGVHLMQSSDGHYKAHWERMKSISNALKQMAMMIEKPIIGVSQLKRVGDKDFYDAEDIAYSDALGQDSDVVLATKPINQNEGRYHIQVVKNRWGPAEIATIIQINWDTMTVVEESTEPEIISLEDV